MNKQECLDILGLDEDAELSDIKTVYRKLAKKYHPDVNRSPNAHQEFLTLSTAYELLKADFEGHSKFNAPKRDEAYWEEVRRRAQRHSSMRYKKFAQDHEAFKESGVHDVALFFQILSRIIAIPIVLMCYILPVFLFQLDGNAPYMAIFFWPVAIFLSLWLYENRKGYFRPDKFYYNYARIKKSLNYVNPNPNGYNCFYCKGEKGNSTSYKISLLKVKDVKLKNQGVLDHRVGYNRIYKNIKIARSKKALWVHQIVSVVKLLGVIISPFFVGSGSLVWNFSIGLVATNFIALLVLFLAQTKSKSNYLLNGMSVVKMLLWVWLMIKFTDFSQGWGELEMQGMTLMVFVILVAFDPFLEMFLKMDKNKVMLKPLLPRYQKLNKFISNGYQYYIDVPLWSILYPFFKWIFG